MSLYSGVKDFIGDIKWFMVCFVYLDDWNVVIGSCVCYYFYVKDYCDCLFWVVGLCNVVKGGVVEMFV